MKLAFGMSFVFSALLHAGGLEFTEIQKDVKAPVDVALVTADFEFTNQGDKTVSIIKTDPGCSCLKVEISGGKLKYAPGESGVVRATFDMGNFSGVVDKVIALWVDGDPADQPSKRLTVRVHIPVLISIEPKTVKWDTGTAPTSQTIQIRMADGKPIHVKDIKSTSEAFLCELKTVEEGKKYDLVVTPKEMNAPGMTVIRIDTDCEIAKHRTQQAFAVVRKPISGVKP